MSKMLSLQKALEQTRARAPEPTPAPVDVSTTRPVHKKAATRVGKVQIGGHFDPNYRRSLFMVQAQTGEDVQELLARALNDLFRAHNVPVVDE